MTGELREEIRDHAFASERLRTTDARHDRALVEYARLLGFRGEQKPRLERNGVLRAGGFTDTTLHAAALDEAQLGHFRLGMVQDGSLRASPHAREAERASVTVHLDRSEGRTGWQCNLRGRYRCMGKQVVDGKRERRALVCARMERR